MFRIDCRLINVLRGQMKNFLAVQKESFRVPALHCSSKPPPNSDEGFGADLTTGEQKLIAKLKREFPNASHLEVADISGGCGAMYQISIETPEFIGKRKLQQQQMVNNVLAEEIKGMHGLQLQTQAPSNDK